MVINNLNKAKCVSEHKNKSIRTNELKFKFNTCCDDMKDLIAEMKVLSETEVTKARIEMLEYAKKQEILTLSQLKHSFSTATVSETVAVTMENAVAHGKNWSGLRHEEKEAKRYFQKFIKPIELLFSIRGSSSRNFSIKQTMKRLQVQSNVQNATSMSREQVGLFFETHADDVLYVDLSMANFSQIGSFIKSQEELQTLESIDAKNGLNTFKLVPFCTNTDGCTAQILMQQTYDKLTDDIQNAFASSSLVIPQGFTTERKNALAFLIPINEDAMLKHPGCDANGNLISWVDRANAPFYSTWRIIARNTFAAIRGFKVNPASKCLGTFLIELLFNLAVNIAPCESSVSFEDSTAIWTRGICCHILGILASGKDKPFSSIYNLIYPHPSFDNVPTSIVEWKWIHQMISIFVKAKWDTTHLFRNVIELVVKIIRKTVHTAVKPLVDMVTQDKIDAKNNSIKTRNEELKWIAIVTQVVLNHKEGLEKEQIARLRELFVSGKQANSVYKALIKYETDENDESYYNLKRKLAGIALRRSGMFKNTKSSASQKIYEKTEKGQREISTESYKKLQEKILEGHKYIQEKFGVSVSINKVQNSKKLMLDFESTEAQFVLGDAEKNMQYYAIGGQQGLDIEEVKKNASYVDSGVFQEEEEHSIASSSTVVASAELSLIELMSHERSGKNEAATKLALQITNREIVKIGDVPISIIVSTLNKLHINDKTSELTECIYHILKTTLQDWRKMNNPAFMNNSIKLLRNCAMDPVPVLT